MADIFDQDGLQVKTLTEIITDLETGFKEIYGSDINVDSNSPDGQVINLFGQALVDLRELLTGINNSFDPDRAVGSQLDERVVINNIARKGGSYTTQPIDVTVDRTVDLAGLDAAFNDPNGTGYTVQDDAGNKFILVDSTTIVAGLHSLNFRAEVIGAVETTVGTITNPVTIVLGVTTINNSSGALEIGTNEETDGELRLRRQQSVALGSTGYLNGLQGALIGIDGTTDAIVYENVTNVVDADGIPAHGIWAIVEGGANTDIGDTIYNRKSYGANMKGAVEVDITTPAGATFTAKFDRPLAKDLYIQFDIQPIVTGAVFDQAAIKTYMVDNLNYTIGQPAETSEITAVALAAINANGGQGVPVNVEISDDDATWVDYLAVDTLEEQWTVDTTRITITEL